MKDYGLMVCRHGVVLHQESRRPVRVASRKRWQALVGMAQAGACRPPRQVRAFSHPSRRRLEFIAANMAGAFRSLVTLTYHGRVEEWETDAERNARVVRRSKRDLNRFLTVLRSELDAYLWVQEFQKRGVIHYHLLCAGEPPEERVGAVWCRATEATDDPDALRHAAKVEVIRSEAAARQYVGRYLGKGRQKLLPPGVETAGRWWGRSRGLQLAVLEEVVHRVKGSPVVVAENLGIVRCVRRYLSRRLGWKFRGGAFVSWGEELTGTLCRVVRELREFHMRSKSTVAAPGGVQEASVEAGGAA